MNSASRRCRRLLYTAIGNIALPCSLIFKNSIRHFVVVVFQQVALAWGIKRGTPVLPKAASEGHIKENIKSVDLKLDEDDMKAIGNIGINHRYFPMTWFYKPEELPEDFWDEKFLG